MILLFLLAGCKKENMGDCFKSEGDMTTEFRDLSGFDRITAEDNVVLYISMGPAFECRVEAGSNLVPLVKTEVKDGRLTVSNDNSCNWVRKFNPEINVFVTVPSLLDVKLDGAGAIRSLDTIKGDVFDIFLKRSGDIDLTLDVNYLLTHIHAGGDIILRGRAGVHETSAVGNGFLRMADLVTGWTFLGYMTTGDAYVHATQGIGATLYSTGNIYYTGNPPDVSSTQFGDGSLIRAD